jgi:regulator of sigma E protease
LDGGRAAMVWLEWARKKRVDAELEAKINSWGMVFLLGILALVTFQDVLNLDWVKKLFGK